MTQEVSIGIIEQFRAQFGDALALQQPLHRFTSARVGGPAELLLTVHSASELLRAVQLAYRLQLPYFILGGGSNILVADAGVRGLVILNRAKRVTFRNTGASIVCTAESGSNLSSLARQCISRGLGGLEWAIGVPGTVGGAVVNNAGAHGSDMSSNLQAAQVWEPGVGVRFYSPFELEYRYRESALKHEHDRPQPRRVVLSADLELKPEAVKVLQARADAFNAHRKQTQPGGATLGSMFKNPEHYYAGYLIEAAGCKGLRVGGVEVSHKHANFFINDENAKAEDIRALVAEVWHAVRDQFQIELEPEIQFVGDWEFDLESKPQPDEGQWSEE